MKLLVELLAGVAACGVVYYLARDPARVVAPSPNTELDAPKGTAPSEHSPPPVSRPPLIPLPREAAATPNAIADHELAPLRNEVITAAMADMRRRGEDVIACLGGAQLAGAEKLRFVIEVSSSAHEAATGQWRFVEIVDGEPLPSSFGTCAAHAFGGGYRVVPPPGQQFPSYRGELSVVYTIPAPS